jgi:hypothetical protein
MKFGSPFVCESEKFSRMKFSDATVYYPGTTNGYRQLSTHD